MDDGPVSVSTAGSNLAPVVLGSDSTVAKPAARLAICFDGTWNAVASRTNVSRLYELIRSGGDDDVPQYKLYVEGVGASASATTPWSKARDAIRGGIFGDGVKRNVLLAYWWLMNCFDEQLKARGNAPIDVYVFGFSRGAFTARLLCGMLGECGLIQLDAAKKYGSASGWENPLSGLAWTYYKPGRSAFPDSLDKAASLARKDFATIDALRTVSRPVAVRFLGVFDTVGAYGVPTFGSLAPFRRIKFGNSELGAHVRDARHAMAIDEHRRDFNVQAWVGAGKSWASEALKPTLPTQIHQRWFAGAHAQVGGGYPNDQLCFQSLHWIANEARTCGLALDAASAGIGDGNAIFRFSPLVRDYLSPLIDSHREFAGGLYRRVSNPVARRISVGDWANDPGAPPYRMKVDIDPSVDRKLQGDPFYRPSNLYHQGRTDLGLIADLS